LVLRRYRAGTETAFLAVDMVLLIRSEKDSWRELLGVIGLPPFARAVNAWSGRSRIVRDILGMLVETIFRVVRTRIFRKYRDAGFAEPRFVWV
jgi:hypothetical protein